jgi:hypothetical protein
LELDDSLLISNLIANDHVANEIVYKFEFRMLSRTFGFMDMSHWPQDDPRWPQNSQDDPNIAQAGPRWPRHDPQITQVDPNMAAKYRQDFKGSVEGREPLEYTRNIQVILVLNWLRMKSSSWEGPVVDEV